MANDSGKCAHSGCRCTVEPGQTYCSPACQQMAQQAGGRQQSQQGSSTPQAGCGCGHAACRQHSG